MSDVNKQGAETDQKFIGYLELALSSSMTENSAKFFVNAYQERPLDFEPVRDEDGRFLNDIDSAYIKFFFKLSSFLDFNQGAVMDKVQGSIEIIYSEKTKILSTIILGIGLENFKKIFPPQYREFLRLIDGKATPDDFLKMISINS